MGFRQHRLLAHDPVLSRGFRGGDENRTHRSRIASATRPLGHAPPKVQETSREITQMVLRPRESNPIFNVPN